MKKKNKSLQGLRAFAFLGVFSSNGHTDFTNLGGWGVSIFLILSGFLMVYSYWDREIKENSFRFSLKKIKKLYFLYALILVLTLAFYVYKASVTAGSSIYFSIIGVGWYLSACFVLYLLFKKILFCIRRYRSGKDAFVVMLILFGLNILLAYMSSLLPESFPLAAFSDDFVKWFNYICPFMRTIDFAIGANLGYLFLNREKQKHTIYGFLLFTILEILAICFAALSYHLKFTDWMIRDYGWIRHSLIWLPSSVLLVYLFACGRGFLSKLMYMAPIQFIADMSPYAFLIHIFIIRVVKFWFPEGAKVPIAIVSFTFTMLCSYGYQQFQIWKQKQPIIINVNKNTV